MTDHDPGKEQITSQESAPSPEPQEHSIFSATRCQALCYSSQKRKSRHREVKHLCKVMAEQICRPKTIKP